MNREQNQQLGEIIQEFIHSYITSNNNIRSQKVFNTADEDTIAQLRKIGFPKKGRPVKEVVDGMMKNVYPHQAFMQHPRCFAFIPSPMSLFSWLGDIMTSAYNPHAGSWVQSSSASFIEGEVIRWMCDQAGYPDTAGGLFMSGGSMSNLTALAAARNARLSEQEYAIGIAYVSEQTHSSVSKGLRILGLRGDQIRKIPSDKGFRMDVSSLEKAIMDDRAVGMKLL
ncbi:pyridoxal phosphate-dependent decarboxylase family protein [Paenibacillus kribbensis]|uniref:pyridoxal phosphate-dependent decarboxylase family protein n=1 Tax=Paenibacillus kribbensis TaxID=172713 RepID=UPI0021177DDC|nr:pyridoxal-dependent decarboxylase [Paenibacillus kribbensis]